MTLPQLAVVLLAAMLLGTLALAFDWSAVLLAADDLAVRTAGMFLPLWEPIERAFLL